MTVDNILSRKAKAMDRRSFVKSTAALMITRQLRAQCRVIPPYGQVCRAELDFTQLVQAITIQQCPEWCWAASIAMIFTFSGHPIDQKQIVQQAYGNVVCLPAQNNANIASALSRKYVDANGKTFTSHITAAFDGQAGYVGINNAIVINALQSNQPLLICNTHHAMVVCAADFAPTPVGPNIYALGVVDPWPYSQRFHPLSPAEIVPVGIPLGMGQQGQMMFVATIGIT